MNTQTNLAQVLANEFELELARISPTHTSRLAKLGQKTLNLMNKMAITAPLRCDTS